MFLVLGIKYKVLSKGKIQALITNLCVLCVKNVLFATLVLQPIIQLHHQRPIPVRPALGEVIVRQHHKQIAHGAVTPLNPAIDVKIVGLGIVL